MRSGTIGVSEKRTCGAVEYSHSLVEVKRFIIEQGNRVYAEESNRLMTSGWVVMPEIEILNRGLDDIQEGLEMLKRGDMNGRKLVVRIS